ncbi:MAG: hypothetical protein AAGC88_14285 [Bacteroidota bacterium]
MPLKDDEKCLNADQETGIQMIGPLPDGSLDYYACEPIKPNKKLGRVYLGNSGDPTAATL